MTPQAAPDPAADAACRNTVARAARCQDERDFAGFVAQFTGDAVLLRPGGATLTGRAAIRAAYEAQPATRITRHLLCGTVVDALAAGRCRARTTVLLWTGDVGDAEGPHGRPAHGPERVGEFDDTLRLEHDGHWRIARREARFVLHR